MKGIAIKAGNSQIALSLGDLLYAIGVTLLQLATIVISFVILFRSPQLLFLDR
jgi:hypothetical protein